MISAKTILVIVALTGICSAAIVKRAPNKCSSTPEETEKAQELFYECFEVVTGKKFTMELFDEDEDYFTETNMENLKICMMKKMDYLSEDEQTFYSDKMEADLDKTGASDALKTEIKKGFEDCVNNNAEARKAVSCAADILKAKCT